jgi:hypothetical protein
LANGFCGLSFWCTNHTKRFLPIPRQIDKYLSYPPYLFNILIPPIQFTTQTIEYNLCPIYLLPLLCFHQCNSIFVAKILYLLLLSTTL